MNVLIIGSGGREHALADAVSKSKMIDSLYCLPGNPGMKDIATLVDMNPLDNDAIKNFAIKNNVSLIIPGSEVYLENGITDTFLDTDIKVFGPNKNAARIESSKEYAKYIMKKYDIPTASYEVFSNYEAAKEYVLNSPIPTVIKYDGLAGGKGVVVATSKEEALEALDLMLKRKVYGNNNVIIEEYLEGPEFSLMTFVHNGTVIPMPIAQDHKRLLDGDKGPNTGGMGIYSTVPIIPLDDIDFAVYNVMQKTVDGMMKEGNSFTGFLYGGLMNTKQGPKVIEFNARFGDPEAEVILPKLESDFLEVINSLFNGTTMPLKWSDKFQVGVVLASKGYPLSYDKGYLISGLEHLKGYVYHMGTRLKENKIYTNGGRVLLVRGEGKTLLEAKEMAYNNVKKITCDNLIYRNDIAHKSL